MRKTYNKVHEIKIWERGSQNQGGSNYQNCLLKDATRKLVHLGNMVIKEIQDL